MVESGATFTKIKQTIAETGKYKHFGDGSKWTLKYLTDNKNLFKGKTLEFELPANIDDLGMRYFDVVDKSAPNKNAWIYYEFKSVAKVPPAHFAEQFLKDLQNADNLDQIKWIFDGKKNPANFKTNMEKVIKNLELGDNLAKKLLPGVRNPNAIKLKQEILSQFDEIFELAPNL